jgi:hypothetical protein
VTWQLPQHTLLHTLLIQPAALCQRRAAAIPMVDVVTSSKRSAVKRISKQLFPTAESPTSSTCVHARPDLCKCVLGLQPLYDAAGQQCMQPHLEQVIIAI